MRLETFGEQRTSMGSGRRSRERSGPRVASALALIAALACTTRVAAAVDAATYDRAAQFLFDNRAAMVLNERVRPHWRAGMPERFTYRRELGGGRAEFVQVVAASGKRTPAFDAAVVAAGLSAALGKTIDPARLPFEDYEEEGEDGIVLAVAGGQWRCSTRTAQCESVRAAPAAADAPGVASPDGRWIAFLQDGNVWVRSADGATRFALTSDAAARDSYGGVVAQTRALVFNGGRARPADAVRDGVPVQGPPSPELPPQLLWSPDSKRLVVQRIDERAVRSVTLVQSVPMDGSVRPLANTWPYAMPNDEHLPIVRLYLLDVEARTSRPVALAAWQVPLFAPIESGEVWWSADARRLYVISRARYAKAMHLDVVDPASGATRRLISETGRTYVEPSAVGQRPFAFDLANGDIVWFSERDGYGHLYLYDGASGALKRRLTQGPWTVRGLLHVDTAAHAAYLAATEFDAGADPYYRTVVRLDLRTGRTTRLTPDAADHDVLTAQDAMLRTVPRETLGFSPSGRFFVATQSTPGTPPVSALRRADGRLVAELERADISALLALGYTPPERFSALAADGRTRLYGNLLRPSKFDASRRYPVLDSPYPGPQHRRALSGFVDTVFDAAGAQAYAELGFIVVVMDGRGSEGRSKAFHDESYGGLGQAGHLDDHVAVIRQLAARYPYMDADRVGVFGTSGGGYATVQAMTKFPEFFKVGVADAGNHDQRGYLAIWGETYNGPESGTNYTDAANPLWAERLRGKLFLLHGDMDANVLPAQTLQVADALIRANRDFELLIVPNAGHGTIMGGRSYALRRAWDFLVRNLIGEEPPAGYAFPPVATE